ncbi:hypothetical protein NKI09_15455 [Mesorhizobium sp. M0757]|uniref:hypothetical protein n=1 Tax=Mesorhizobium sp. M0757 TaxID=2956993 RepID=UPI00333DE7A6
MFVLNRAFPTISLFCTLLTGCQVIESSVEYKTLQDGRLQQHCTSAFGSYSLSYSTIKVTISQNYSNATNTPVGGAYLGPITPTRHPDGQHTYCLEFLESLVSDDKVDVYYSGLGSANTAPTPDTVKPNGLLQLVVSKNVDRTGEIIQKLLRLIFIIISGAPGDGFGRVNDGSTPRQMTEQDVNPFDVAALARLNRSIRQYGFCVTLGKFTYDVDALTPDQYCNDPERALEAPARSPHLQAALRQNYLVKKLPTGIFYRPRQGYPLFVFVRDDPAVGPWRLRKVDTILLENISPIMVLGVNRSIFAEHRTAMAFDDGDLVDFCVAKGSEVEGFIQIPLDVVYGIVSLPSVTITAELELKAKQIGLLDAQKQVLIAQEAYLDFLADSSKGTASQKTGKALSKDETSLGFSKAADTSPLALSTISNKAAADFCGMINAN